MRALQKIKKKRDDKHNQMMMSQLFVVNSPPNPFHLAPRVFLSDSLFFQLPLHLKSEKNGFK
jgi:hypothetical protein